MMNGKSWMNELYTIVEIPKNGRVIKMLVSGVSHDQGWADSGPGDRTGYAWGEICYVDENDQEILKIKDVGCCCSRNMFTNLRACKHWQKHFMEIDIDENERDFVKWDGNKSPSDGHKWEKFIKIEKRSKSDWLKNLNDHKIKKIGVKVKSCYPGWACFVKRIDVCFIFTTNI